MTFYDRMGNKLGMKAIDREFEVLYTLYHHESLSKDGIPHHLHYPECNWLETTLDDLERSRLITRCPAGGWIYKITGEGRKIMRAELRAELSRLSRWYVYKAYLIMTSACGVGLYDAAKTFDDFENQGIFKEDVNTVSKKETL